MRLKFFYIIILLVSVQNSFAQTLGSKILRGEVVVPNGDATGVAIQNISNEKGTITDAKGNFSIQVKLNDTLVFSSVQLKRKMLPISKTVFESSFVTVDLEMFVNELSGVVVSPFNLSGNLSSDLGTLKLAKDVSAEALGLPNADVPILSQSENKLNDADHGKYAYNYIIALTINLNKVLNKFSGRTKMLKERVALDKAYDDVQQVENKYQDSILVSHLKIPKANFYDFIYFCEMDESFSEISSQNDELKLWQFLMEKSKIYRKENGLD